MNRIIMNKLMVKHVNDLFKTAYIISNKNKIYSVPLPSNKMKSFEELIEYSSLLNKFIRNPSFNYIISNNSISTYDYNYKKLDINLFIHHTHLLNH